MNENKRQRLSNGQSKKNNPDKLATQRTQDEALYENKHKSHGTQNVCVMYILFFSGSSINKQQL